MSLILLEDIFAYDDYKMPRQSIFAFYLYSRWLNKPSLVMILLHELT